MGRYDQPLDQTDEKVHVRLHQLVQKQMELLGLLVLLGMLGLLGLLVLRSEMIPPYWGAFEVPSRSKRTGRSSHPGATK